MGMRGRKRKDRRKKAANHGKRPNDCFFAFLIERSRPV